MADPKLIAQARRILEQITPLPFDCGTLCGNRCCTDFKPDEGVYLIPGELPLFDGTEEFPIWQFHRTDEYEFAPSWEKYDHVVFMQCKTVCAKSREKRPFECRTYPLLPYLHGDGRLEMRYSFLAAGICPLVERYRLEELQPEFVRAAGEAWALLMQDPEMLDHVKWLSQQFDALELPLAEAEEGA
ncbi:MAG: hypothetical protein ACOY94_25540 [Bacillota bacterium]